MIRGGEVEILTLGAHAHEGYNTLFVSLLVSVHVYTSFSRFPTVFFREIERFSRLFWYT